MYTSQFIPSFAVNIPADADVFPVDAQTIFFAPIIFAWEVPDWIVYPGGALGNTSSCGKALMELYEWGWIKKNSKNCSN